MHAGNKRGINLTSTVILSWPLRGFMGGNLMHGFRTPTLRVGAVRSKAPYPEFQQVLLGSPWPALRGPLRNQFWKKKRHPRLYWGEENSGNALEASNAFNYRVWGHSRGIPGKTLRAFPQLHVLGVWPNTFWRILPGFFVCNMVRAPFGLPPPS